MTIEEMEKQVKELQEEIERMKSETNKEWYPQEEETYWIIDGTGIILKCDNLDNDYTKRNKLWCYGGLFRTESEVERYKQFRKDILSRSYEFSDEEWNDDNIPKYYIRCWKYNSVLEADYIYSQKHFGTIYFRSEEDAQYIIDNYSEELKKGWRV